MIRDRFCNTFVTPGDFAISFWTVTRNKNALSLDLDPTKIEENQMSVSPFQFDLYPGVSQHASAMGCTEQLCNLRPFFALSTNLLRRAVILL